MLNVPTILAQSAGSQKFEVVSVRPCKVDAESGGGRKGNGESASASPGRLDLSCRTVMSLIRLAYVQFADGERRALGQDVPIEGGPAWIGSEGYAIDAKAEGAPGQAMMSGPMLQALLEDRFRLKLHHGAREVPVYALSVAKGGAKLQVAQSGKCIPRDLARPMPSAQGQAGLFHCGVFVPSSTKDGAYMYGTTLANFCAQLSIVLDRRVVDKTGIAGVFDIHVETRPADPGDMADSTPRSPGPLVPASPTDPLGSAIFAAVQKVGLRLESAKGSGDFLVVDRVEKPTAN